MSDRIARVVGGNGSVPANGFRSIGGNAQSPKGSASARPSPLKDVRLHMALGLLACLALGFYAHNQHRCESLKASGQFFYGMTVDRCMAVLNRNPVKAVTNPLAALGGSY